MDETKEQEPQGMGEIEELLVIVKKLHDKYPHRDFPLDGRLVGDIGEIIAENNYEITLYPPGKKKYDGFSEGKQIQIKATFTDTLTFPCDIPDYYPGIKICNDGTHEEVYNGPGKYIWELVKSRKRPASGLFSVGIKTLKAENAKIIEPEERIKRKNKP